MQLLYFYLLIPILLACSAGDPPFPADEIVQNESNPSDDPNLKNLILPEGFHIEYYTKDIENARSMCLAPSGTLYVGTRNKGNVYAVVDHDKDNVADEIITLAKGLHMPNGVAYRDGDLYVAEVNRILRFSAIESNLKPSAPYEVINESYPTDTHHGWKYIAFGPDEKLYVPVGAPCNICESENEIYNTITRINTDGTGLEIVQRGIRNTVGFAWRPGTDELWFSDNGRDWLGDNSPSCELNRAEKDGLHFGYPYCHQGDLPDPEFGDKRPCSDFVAPVQNLGPHVAPLGIEFYTGSQFPTEYQNQIFIAEHGSWNRSTPIGYRITMVTVEEGEAINYSVFAEGWLQGRRPSGRPVDLEQLPDGSLLVSDDHGDAIYRIRYDHP
ncbi:MAG: PQQ-dependent sugar dehydrogenase [Saprospiraceae bacterium]|nr:PQQ-dependent sugar dehydrogenase [Saprospiraceae bacterium]